MKNKNPFERFGNEVLHMIIFAKAASIDAHVDAIYPESFVIGTLMTGENVVTDSLDSHDSDTEDCIKRVKRKLASRASENSVPKSEIGYENIEISQEIVDICDVADKVSKEAGSETIGLGHIFAATIQSSISLRKIFSDNCTNFKDCLCELSEEKYKPSTRKRKGGVAKVDESIKSYCIDMTELASKGKFDPIISRDKEIEEAITILCRRSKSNPLLIGEAGVGKTAIVEGIAQRIVGNTVPKRLKGFKIYSLNLSSIVAGTKYRGDFEKRIQVLIKALESDKKSIVFIDELHTIVGAGAGGGAMDAANLLKPALARDLKCIGATTNKEYKKYLEDDGALSRRFGTVTIEEPSEIQVKKILMGIKERFEQYHECNISNDAIDSIIEMTKRYRPTKFFPDKAIDCMDTACAKYSWKDDNDDCWPVINSEDIAKVISQQSNVPIEVIMWDTNERIKKAEDTLKSRVVGQSGAIESVCRVLRNAYSGVRNPEKPMGVLVFGGPSGTGKTHLSKELSKSIFGNEKSLIRMDMTEYAEEHSISKIIGSPPGYVGFKESDVIIDSIKRRPYSVFLLDEIEKAHPKVMKLFLQAMSDGVLTSANGEKIDCKNIFFVMTGNFGLHVSRSSEIGFGSNELSAHEEKKGQMIEFCEKIYGKEFINRIDCFVPFMPLSESDLSSIAKIKLNELANRVSNGNIKVKIGKKAVPAIISQQKMDHGVNAMAIDRIISSKVEPLVADTIIETEDINRAKYSITINGNNENEVTVTKRRLKD